jgi:cupin 2 domain-containing protein
MDVGTGNLFATIPEELRDELFTSLAQGKNTNIKRIVSRGHSSPDRGWYDQADNEWVLVLKGEARLLFENHADVHLGLGDYINIPAHTRHKVAWTTPASETVWLAVHYT